MKKILAFTVLTSAVFLSHASLAEEKSAYDDIPEFGGPSSVGVQLKDDNQIPLTGDFIKDNMQGWFANKEAVMKKHGLAYGLNFSTLYQKANSTGESLSALSPMVAVCRFSSICRVVPAACPQGATDLRNTALTLATTSRGLKGLQI